MRVFIGLGSNLQQPKVQVMTAVKDLQTLPESHVIACSSAYLSPPMGPQNQPDYINAVVEISTTLSPLALLDALQQIELKHGRVRQRHWGERTLDLDILLYGEQILDDERLKLPHPGLPDRAFVVYPLAELAADLAVPGMGNIAQIKANCPLAGLQKLEPITL